MCSQSIDRTGSTLVSCLVICQDYVELVFFVYEGYCSRTACPPRSALCWRGSSRGEQREGSWPIGDVGAVGAAGSWHFDDAALRAATAALPAATAAFHAAATALHAAAAALRAAAAALRAATAAPLRAAAATLRAAAAALRAAAAAPHTCTASMGPARRSGHA